VDTPVIFATFGDVLVAAPTVNGTHALFQPDAG
jgi:hypothetical protein